MLKFSWTSSRKQCPREQILDHSFAKQAWVSNHWFDTYPDAMQEIRWAKRAWKAGCEELEARILSNSEIIKLITSRGSHFRGQVKTKVSHHFKGMYGFVASTDRNIIEKNVTLSRDLKKKFAFTYAERLPSGNKGLYQHPILQEVVNEQWFSNKKDDGIKFSEVYKPFPKVAFALILTAVECCIDEWTDGTRSNVQFMQEAYEDIFHEHLEELNRSFMMLDDCTLRWIHLNSRSGRSLQVLM